MPSDLRVVSVVEGTSVTGPIKPLLMFARLARDGGEGRPTVDLSLATTTRGRSASKNLLETAADDAGIRIDVFHERRAWDLGVLTQLCDLIENQRPNIVETHQVKCHFILAQAILWRRLRRNFAWVAYHHGYTAANRKVRAL